ncbi:MAG TPA: glycine betaine ABC transporter substrate-binding protein [Burkholderiales bacterium]|nr:glycine betaine ABC transporter substrate-binding protein [Burkholderiales bacterium]
MWPSRVALALALATACGVVRAETLAVGSKRFTESYILGEIVAQAAGGTHRPGLGNTAVLLEALRAGSIDVYPEYTGTIAREILQAQDRLDLAGINRRLAPLGLVASVPLGFGNSYALGMRRADTQRLGIQRVSDLRSHAALRLGLSHEFLGRNDGWPGLRAAYILPQQPRGLDHGIAYEALAAGRIDVMDLYTTDAKIERYAIVALEDDLGFFPAYDAVLLHRADAPQRFPAAFRQLAQLENRIDAATMVRLNARAELDKVPFAEVAREFLGGKAQRRSGLWPALAGPDFPRLLAEHLGLVFASVALASLAGVPLGLLAAKVPWTAQPVLALTGLLQTIPSLALLAFLIPLTGTIGLWPALIALFLYALLPITRNTHAGLVQVPAGLVQAGRALGLRPASILARIELPLAARTIMAGVKTSAVISVGTATIAAFIGAGGFGERIAQGLALNDHVTLLAGAIPAAVLALLVQGVFELGERCLARAPGS